MGEHARIGFAAEKKPSGKIVPLPGYGFFKIEQASDNAYPGSSMHSIRTF